MFIQILILFDLAMVFQEGKPFVYKAVISSLSKLNIESKNFFYIKSK